MKTLKQYVRFVLLLTICFSVVWPGGAWAAAGDEMMGPGLKQQAVMRYLAGYLKSQAGSGGKVMTYEYGFKPLSEKRNMGSTARKLPPAVLIMAPLLLMRCIG